MDKTSIQNGLESFSEKLDSQTYLGTFRQTSRSSLLNYDGLSTRANSIWKMAQYIIATYDNDDDKSKQDYIKGWLILTRNYKDQFLFLEVNEGQWELYDHNGVLLGGNEYIGNFISKMSKASNNSAFGMLANDNSPKQVIFFGAPGTSKSTCIKNRIGKCPQHRITFHPDTDYSNFVGTYKPTMSSQDKVYLFSELVAALKEIKLTGVTYPCHKFAAKYWRSLKDLSTENLKKLLTACGFTESMIVEIGKGIAIGEDFSNRNNEGEIKYDFVAQTFVNAYVEAWKKLVNENETEKKVFLVIEEINRGNCAQIFGDLFQLLDRDGDGYSDYEIEPDADLQRYLAAEFAGNLNIPSKIANGAIMKLPPNLYIWATMNTSDQSLFPIDSAFKRRWDWKYMPINNAGKGHVIALKDRLYDWWEFIDAVNKRIEKVTESEDKQIGYWFARPDNGLQISSEKFVSKVIFYLWNDVFKDYGHDVNSPFVIKQDDGNKVELRFKSFFDENGNVNENVLVLFFWGLKLETKAAAPSQEQGNNDDSEEEALEDNNEGNSSKDLFGDVNLDSSDNIEEEITQDDEEDYEDEEEDIPVAENPKDFIK